MTEQGKVVSVKGNNARVKVYKKDECEKCGLCLFRNGADSVTYSAENSVGAKEGDEVIISTTKDGKFLGVILAFFVPLLLIGVAYVIEHFTIKNELWFLFLSLIFIVLWYFALYFIDKKIDRLKAFAPKIESIVNTESTEQKNGLNKEEHKEKQ